MLRAGVGVTLAFIYIPLAAAFTMVPMVVMVVYLLVAKRLGAFEAL
jgi:hypothetical protein